MLALTRKKDQALIINNNIEIKILDIRGDQIKLGVQAPKDVSVYRKEVYQQIQDANKEAMTGADLEAIRDLL
jgi:carbon storage regulator